jgi:OmpA-OmpF porin, OOP family
MRFSTSGAAAALLLASMAPAVAQMAPPPPPPPPPGMAPPPPPVMVSAFNWTGLYAGIEVGGDWAQFPGRVSVGTTTGVAATAAGRGSAAGSVPLSNNFSGSFAGGGQIGYNWQFPSNWVLGGEIDFKGDDSQRTTTLGVAPLTPLPVLGPFAGNDRFRASTHWNGSARARLGYAWGAAFPYITGGVAFADEKVQSSFVPVATAAGTAPGSAASDSSTLIGWTVGAGLEYALSPSWSLGGEYRYADYGNETFNLGRVATVPTGTAAAPTFATAPVSARVGLREHSLLFKLNYHFGAPPPPPPAPVAAPMPPPAAPRVFIVFFDWDRDTITPEGQQIIAQAADAYRSGAPVQIQVTGYTDRSGSPGYNQRLSERRANNVAKALAGMGVPPTQMVVSGRGENDNRVPTADGVREPQNRRVEIVAQ